MTITMRRLIHTTFVIAMLAFVTGCASVRAAADNSIFSAHFIGTEELADDEKASAVFDILNLPEGKRVRETLARQLVARTRNFTPGISGVSSNAMHAFYEDFLRVETAVQIKSLKPAAWSVALKSGAKRAKSWEGEWNKAAKSSGGKLTLARRGAWLGIGVGTQPVFPGKLDGVMHLRATPAILRDFVGPVFPNPPAIDLTYTIRKGRVRTEGTMSFAQAQKLNLAPFRWPENSLRDPLVGLNIVRGIKPWISQFKLLRDWRVREAPNQAILWTQSDVPFHTLVSVPFPKVKPWLVKQKDRAVEWLQPNLAKHGLGSILLTSNNHHYGWSGVPIIAPFIGAAPEPTGDWLMAGTMISILPRGKNGSPPPAGLLDQFRKSDDLIYYEWEITQNRLRTARFIGQIAQMIGGRLVSGGPTQKWLNALGNKLGNSVTEVLKKDNKTWNVTRSSNIGFNSFELAFLGYWLENSDFPKLKRPKATGPPVPFARPPAKK